MNSLWRLITCFLLLFVACTLGCALRTTTELNTGNEPDKVRKKQLDKYLEGAKGKRPTELMKHLPKNYYR
jgi:hypothetical protein